MAEPPSPPREPPSSPPRAETVRPRLDALLHPHPGAHRFREALRRLVRDRLVDAERVFQATLGELRHAHDVVRQLRDVARQHGDVELLAWCDEFLVERDSLLERAEAALGLFAEEPRRTHRPRLAAPPSE